MPDDDPTLETSRWIDSTFGSSLFILVGLQRKYDKVFNRIRDYIDKVSAISTVKEVVSIVSADYITSVDDTIIVEKLISDDFTGTTQEIAELKKRLHLAVRNAGKKWTMQIKEWGQALFIRVLR